MELSTIHGLNYLEKKLSKMEKIFWIFSLVLVFCLFVVLVGKSFTKFFNDQTVINLSKRRYYSYEVPFPAVTLCPEIASGDGKIEKDDGIYSLLGLKNVQNYTNYDENQLVDDLKRYTQSNWFKNYVFGSWKKKYSLRFSIILNRHGFCFTFNMQPVETLLHLNSVSSDFHYNTDIQIDPAEFSPAILNSSQPWYPDESSSEMFLKFKGNLDASFDDDLMDSEESDSAYNASNPPLYNASNFLQPNDGILWILHSPNNFPALSDQQSYLKFYAYSDVVIMLDMFLIDDGLKAWSPEKRNCYLPGEMTLTFFKIYSKINCEQECISLATSEKCGCVPFHMIRGPNTRICGIKDIQCYKTAEDEFYDDGIATKRCKCLNECEFVKYRMNCEHYADNGRTIMVVSFQENNFFALVKQRSIGTLEFIGSFGGLMGLVAGMSMLSIVEVSSKALIVVFQKVNQHRIRNRVWSFESLEQTSNRSAVTRSFGVRKLLAFIHRFLGESSIHGLQNIVDSRRSVYEKVVWALIVFGSISICSYTIFDATKRSELNPIEFGTDERIWHLNDISFPAITICLDMAMDRHRLHEACRSQGYCPSKYMDTKLIERIRDPVLGALELKPMRYLCRNSEDFNHDENKFDRRGVRTELVPPIFNKLRRYTRPDVIRDGSFCYNGLSEIQLNEVLTEYGICYAFNLNLDMLNRESVSKDFLHFDTWKASCRNPDTLQQSNNLRIDFKITRKSRCNHFIGSATVTNHNAFNFFRSAIFLDKLFTTVVSKPKITTTDESLRKYSPKVRGCLFEDENHLKYFTKYSMPSCLEECRSNLTLNSCQCVPFFVIRGNEERICNHVDLECTNEVSVNLTNVEHEDYKSCKCLPDCFHVAYNYENIHERFTVENQSKYEEHTAASFRFDDDEFVAYKRYESYGTVGLLSNIGGLLGLFLGVSVLSIIETIYFFTLRLFNDACC